MATNLVHNAIVHNLPDHGTVWVTTSAHPESVVLTVENTGEQLTPRLVSTLAEPFQRGAERIRTDHAGVGLGLAIVKSITQAHDGTLTLTPRPAGGLCVTVRLPAAPPHTAPERTKTRSMTGLFVSSGGRIRTCDLRVMSPTSYQTAPPRGGLMRLSRGSAPRSGGGRRRATSTQPARCTRA